MTLFEAFPRLPRKPIPAVRVQSLPGITLQAANFFFFPVQDGVFTPFFRPSVIVAGMILLSPGLFCNLRFLILEISRRVLSFPFVVSKRFVRSSGVLSFPGRSLSRTSRNVSQEEDDDSSCCFTRVPGKTFGSLPPLFLPSAETKGWS